MLLGLHTILERNPEELYGEAVAEARKHTGRRIDARVASFDLSLSDPKSVSLVAAGSPPEVRAERSLSPNGKVSGTPGAAKVVKRPLSHR